MSESDCCGSRIRNPSWIIWDGICMDCKEHCSEMEYDEAHDQSIESINPNIWDMLCTSNVISNKKKLLNLKQLENDNE